MKTYERYYYSRLCWKTCNLIRVNKRKVNIICAISILNDVILLFEDGNGEYVDSANNLKKGAGPACLS